MLVEWLPDVESDGVPPVDVDPPVDGVVLVDPPVDDDPVGVEVSVGVSGTGSSTVVVPDEGSVVDVVPDNGAVSVVVPGEGSVTEVVPDDGSVAGVVPEEGAAVDVVPVVVSLLVVLAAVVPEAGGVPEPDPAEDITAVPSAPPTVDHSERLATEPPLCPSVLRSLRTGILQMPVSICRNVETVGRYRRHCQRDGYH